MARDYALYGPIGVTYASETGTRDAVISGAYLGETSGGAAYSLTCSGATFAYAGQATVLTGRRKLVGALGAFAFIGGAISFHTPRAIAAGTGSFGFDLAAVQAAMLAAAGVYTLSGQAAGLLYTPVTTKLVASAGLFAFVGTDTEFFWNLPFQVSGGSYTLTGQDAAFAKPQRIFAELGNYTLIGASSDLTAPKIIAYPIFSKVIIAGPS